ncbi:hypothetical protein [Kitasatospora sp. KL5]|uniref:hypothetical protein n=1 Tax=Kitasatospora sp. KL5 TaxID=3425125 RepID=UPI003D6E3B74
MTGLTRVPASCTLPTAEQPLRIAAWDALLAERLHTLDRTGPLRLRLVLAGGEGVEEKVRDLADRESDCCSFFTFTVRTVADAVHLDVAVDGAHQAVLEALQARAAAGGTAP